MNKNLRISRKATISDANVIRRLIADEHLNPMGLNWQRFLVIEEQGKIVGIGQVKPHSDGSRELASLVVVPSHQGLGIGTELVEMLMAQELHTDTLYVMCAPPLETYYQRFGFVKIARNEMTPYFKRLMWAVQPIISLMRLFSADAQAPLVMRRLNASHALK